MFDILIYVLIATSVLILLNGFISTDFLNILLRLFSFAADAACKSNPCAKEALCLNRGVVLPNYKCACMTGYYGLTCAGKNTYLYAMKYHTRESQPYAPM